VSWDPYLDLEHGVLRNRLGLTDPGDLARAEADLVATRIVDLQRTDLPGGYDLDHLQEFHEHLFGDVYDWAGELRTVAIGRGAPFCHPADLRAEGGRVFARLARAQHLRGPDRAAFVDGLAVLFAEVNALHPFREGNGRTLRAFLSQLSRAAGHPVRWAGLEREENVAASKAAHAGDLVPLRGLLDRLVAVPTGPDAAR
jgi:cell filamentation protein